MTQQTGLQAEGLSSSGALAPFANSLFFGIWTANLASSLGGQIQQVGTSWLMVALAPSPQMIALVSSAVTAPILFFSLVSGALADVVDRRKVLLVAQCFMLLVSACLSVLSYADAVSPALLLFATFLLFSGFALNAPASQALIGEIVPRGQLSAAIALNTLGMNVARTIGPAVGGLVVGSFGPKAAFAANAVSYIALIVVLMSWRRPVSPATTPPEPVLVALAAGLRYVAHSHAVRPILVRAFWVGIGASSVTALAPVVVSEVLGAGPVEFGTLLTCSGLGAVMGAAASHPLRVRLSYEATTRLALFFYAAGILTMAVSRSLPLTGAAMMLTGGSMVLSLSTFGVAVQSNVPAWVAGRAISIYQMSMFGGMTAGSVVWGQLAGAAGTPAALLAAGTTMGLTLLIGFHWPVRAIDPDHLTVGEPDESLGWEHETSDPEAALAISIEYRIPDSAREEFLELMRERRRIRLRDGARRWSLLQDVTHPEEWVERFETRSSHDYTRYRARSTTEDQIVSERIRALDPSGRGPRPRLLYDRSSRLGMGRSSRRPPS